MSKPKVVGMRLFVDSAIAGWTYGIHYGHAVKLKPSLSGSESFMDAVKYATEHPTYEAPSEA